MRQAYLKELGRLRRFLDLNISNFPHNKCQFTTRILRELFGFQEVGGRFSSRNYWHAWNFDPKTGLYVDLTGDQFIKVCCKKINIVPNTSQQYTPIEAITEEVKSLTNQKLGLDFEAFYGSFKRFIYHK